MKKEIRLMLFLFVIGVLMGITGTVIFNNGKKVNVVVTESNKVTKYTLEREDSLRKVWETEKDSIIKEKEKHIEKVKEIDKNLKHENKVSNTTGNIDSLRKGAINYVNTF